jgi:hypothetical protein
LLRVPRSGKPGKAAADYRNGWRGRQESPGYVGKPYRQRGTSALVVLRNPLTTLLPGKASPEAAMEHSVKGSHHLSFLVVLSRDGFSSWLPFLP